MTPTYYMTGRAFRDPVERSNLLAELRRDIELSETRTEQLKRELSGIEHLEQQLWRFHTHAGTIAKIGAIADQIARGQPPDFIDQAFCENVRDVMILAEDAKFGRKKESADLERLRANCTAILAVALSPKKLSPQGMAVPGGL